MRPVLLVALGASALLVMCLLVSTTVSAAKVSPDEAERSCHAAVRQRMPDASIGPRDPVIDHPHLGRMNLTGKLVSGGRLYRYVCKVSYSGFVLHDGGLMILPWGQ